jgi:hydroxyacylglutathione hydrolase
MGLIVEWVVVPPFMENAYVIGEETTREALLVDPGGEVAKLAGLVKKLRLTPKAIFCTHAHIDHAAGAAEAQKRFPVPFLMHAADKSWLDSLTAQSALFGFPRSEPPTMERWLEDGEELSLGSVVGRLLHTPGHTPGCSCLYFPSEKVLFSGDTLFVGSIGRTDLPGGSFEEITRSIRTKLLSLPDEVVFYPGHGPSGSLGRERRNNPFVGECAESS